MSRPKLDVLALRLLSTLAVVGVYGLAAVPVGLYLWFIDAYGVNVPFQDSWNSSVPIAIATIRGQLSLALLWTPSNGNRMLFPNLIELASDTITRLNEKVDMYLAAACMIAALILLSWLAVRTAKVSGVWLLPLAFLMCDLVQVQNILWAFQLAWALVVLCLLVSLCGLELGQRHWFPFLLAIIAAVVGSFSSLQGLLIWPAGLAYLLCLRSQRPRLLVWLGCAVAAPLVYFWNLGPLSEDNSLRELVHDPALAAHFYLRLLGGFAPDHANDVGALLLAGSLGLAWLAWSRRPSWGTLRLSIALCLFVLLFDLVVTEGRLRFGLSYALTSRYTTYNLIFLIGVYIGAVAILMPGRDIDHFKAAAASQPLAALTVTAVTVAIAVQVFSSIPNGFAQGQSYRSLRNEGGLLLRHYKTTSNATFGKFLYAPDGGPVKTLAPTLAHDHLSVFS